MGVRAGVGREVVAEGGHVTGLERAALVRRQHAPRVRVQRPVTSVDDALRELEVDRAQVGLPHACETRDVGIPAPGDDPAVEEPSGYGNPGSHSQRNGKRMATPSTSATSPQSTTSTGARTTGRGDHPRPFAGAPSGADEQSFADAAGDRVSILHHRILVEPSWLRPRTLDP